MGDRPSICAQSLLCKSVIPSARCTSSRELGWTSLLLDLHSGNVSTEPYTSIATSDPRVGVTISGRYSAEYYTRSRWRHDAHGPGSINIHQTGETTRYRFPPPQDPDYQMALIYFPFELLRSAAEHLRKPGQPSEVPAFVDFVDRDPAITQMAHALVHAMSMGAGDLYAETVSAWLAVHMLHRYGPNVGRADARNAGVITDQRLSRVIEFISEHFADPLTLEQLADEACISRYHFARLFKSKVGESPHRYLANVRLDAARRMLQTTDTPIAQVGAACGYPSGSHFSAAFTAHFGVTPREFRNPGRYAAGSARDRSN